MKRIVVIDTNILITFFTSPPTELEEEKLRSVLRLFNEIENGRVQGILPEVVLHELFYTLLGKRFPDTQLPTLCESVAALMEWPGWKFEPGELDIYLRAFQILQSNPKLELSDSIIAARAEAHNADLATFDRQLARTYSGDVWSAD